MEKGNQDDKTLGVGTALINKVSTMTDGGFRVTLDFPETDLELIQRLLSKKSTDEPTVLVVFIEED